MQFLPSKALKNCKINKRCLKRCFSRLYIQIKTCQSRKTYNGHGGFTTTVIRNIDVDYYRVLWISYSPHKLITTVIELSQPWSTSRCWSSRQWWFYHGRCGHHGRGKVPWSWQSVESSISSWICANSNYFTWPNIYTSYT